MAKKSVLLIADDPKVKTSVQSILSDNYSLSEAADVEQAASYLKKNAFNLVLIDFDLKTKDGLEVFRDLKTSVKTVMLSSANNIPLAVSAAKTGVTSVLRKPINAEELKKIVADNVSALPGKLRWPPSLGFLQGQSPLVLVFRQELEAVLSKNDDLIVLAENGIPKKELVQFIHDNSLRRGNKLLTIDLSNFVSANQEALLWASLQAALKLEKPDSLPREENRTGTLYLENIEALNSQLTTALIDFLVTGRPNFDKSIRLVISLAEKSLLSKYNLANFVRITVPNLRQRKDDLAFLIAAAVQKYALASGKDISFIATDVLTFLGAHDFWGNYQELEKLIELAVVRAETKELSLKDFPLSFTGLAAETAKLAQQDSLSLASAQKLFEQKLIKLLWQKSEDELELSRFLDLPKVILLGRL